MAGDEIQYLRRQPRADTPNQVALLSEGLRSANYWAWSRGYVGALTSFCALIPRLAPAEYEFMTLVGPDFQRGEITFQELNDSQTDPLVFRSVHEWAVAHGYVSAFPTFSPPNKNLTAY